jgi:Ran-binding protein 9/10
VGLKKPGEAVRANFGQFPFVFDIDSEVHRERSTLALEISKTTTIDLRPKTSETTLIQELISQYLAHEGYVETARSFASEVEQETRTLSSSGRSEGGVPVVEEDVNAVHRQRKWQTHLNT